MRIERLVEKPISGADGSFVQIKYYPVFVTRIRLFWLVNSSAR
jgi:hypothetical protein